ncbi:transglycosylase SLT domain-containing protein [Tropicimonas sp. IMCC6043]|uniref:transglycosylase SLT domain-containing protein n=1 Tax=Tropicimonas sp. IMCC6043 TaxID=2510645 RepID=UPI001A936EA5|nr:transglycosylase SLT domain-containing protein [Tropicimonas sp. IMCC6043]
MRRAIVILVCLICLCAAVAPGPALSSEPHVRPLPRPADLGRADRRCTDDGALCITLANYVPDICRAIETSAAETGLNTGFFARLIWRESLFDAGAVSPAGAQGIAQFMPATAALRGLSDPFNPAEALRASARYLAELGETYGNVGLAAAAYNAGEARLEDFLARGRRLPLETRIYVLGITGYSATDWRDDPPEDWDLALSDTEAFTSSCQALARNRSFSGFRDPMAARPWAVIVAANPERLIAETRLAEIRERSELVSASRTDIRRMRLPAKHGTQWVAQIGADDRREADRLCGRLRSGGVGCIVLRN